MGCKYCTKLPRSRYTTQARLIDHRVPSASLVGEAKLFVEIQYDDLGNPELSGWYEDYSDSMDDSVPIKFCPMCGEEL